MLISTTAKRLKEIMVERNLRQVDVLELCKPYSIKYNVRIGRSDLSQYLSGKYQPGSSKLTVLGLGLGLNEAWLMGYDVPKERDAKIEMQLNHIVIAKSTGEKLQYKLSDSEIQAILTILEGLKKEK